MELKVKKDELLKSTGRAQAISEKRSAMQILANLLLKASIKRVEVLATDLEIGFHGSCEAEVIAEGSVCLPARTFHSIIRELGGEEIRLKELGNHRVLIESGRTRYELAGLPAEEYPALPDHEKVETIEVSVEDLKEMLDKTIFSMAAEEGRYNLAGVYLEKVKDETLLRLVSTDGHRLSLIERALDRLVNLDLAKGAILPRKGVLEMRRLLEEATAARLGIKGSTAVLKVGDSSLIMRLMETRYPDYRQVIPSDQAAISFVAKRPELLEALRRISLLITDQYRGIRMDIGPEGIILSHRNPDLGEAREALAGEHDIPSLTLGFNGGYVMEALKAMRSEEVRFSLNEPLKPFKITGEADENFLAVIMPLQL